MKKSLKILFISLLFISLGLGAFFYFHTRKAVNIIVPEFQKIEEVNISFAGDTLLLNGSIQFENKSFFKLSIDSLIYKIQLDTLTLLSRQQFLGAKFQPGEVDTIHLPVYLPFKRLSHEIKELQKRDSVGITFDLHIVYSTLFGKTSVPYKKTINIAVPVPPKIEIVDLSYADRSNKQFNFNASVKVINKGKLDLYISDIDYSLTVKNNLKAEGKISNEYHVLPSSEKIFILPVQIKFEKLFRTLMSMVINQDEVNYELKVDALVRVKKIGEEKTKIHLEKKGITELKK